MAVLRLVWGGTKTVIDHIKVYSSARSIDTHKTLEGGSAGMISSFAQSPNLQVSSRDDHNALIRRRLDVLS